MECCCRSGCSSVSTAASTSARLRRTQGGLNGGRISFCRSRWNGSARTLSQTPRAAARKFSIKKPPAPVAARDLFDRRRGLRGAFRAGRSRALLEGCRHRRSLIKQPLLGLARKDRPNAARRRHQARIQSGFRCHCPFLYVLVAKFEFRSGLVRNLGRTRRRQAVSFGAASCQLPIGRCLI